jgi:hypothetical protein
LVQILKNDRRIFQPVPANLRCDNANAATAFARAAKNCFTMLALTLNKRRLRCCLTTRDTLVVSLAA